MGDEKYSSTHSKPRLQASADLYTGTHRTGGRVGPTAGFDALEKGNSCPCQESKQRFLGRTARRIITTPGIYTYTGQ